MPTPIGSPHEEQGSVINKAREWKGALPKLGKGAINVDGVSIGEKNPGSGLDSALR